LAAIQAFEEGLPMRRGLVLVLLAFSAITALAHTVVTLSFLVCLATAMAAQDQSKPVVRLGVGMFQNSTPPVSAQLGRDLLTGFLNSHPQSNERVLVQAWPLRAAQPDQTMGVEARSKQCRFVVVASLLDLSGPGVATTLCVIPTEPGAQAKVQGEYPNWGADFTGWEVEFTKNVADRVMEEFGKPDSTIHAQKGETGCIYSLILAPPFINLTGGSGVGAFRYETVKYAIRKAGESRPIVNEGIATIHVRDLDEAMTPQAAASITKEIVQQVQGKLSQAQSHTSGKSSDVIAAVGFNLIDVSSATSIAKGRSGGGDPAGSARTAIENALQQAASDALAELHKKVAPSK